MTDNEQRTPAVLAILTLSEIKAAADRFDRGAVNVFEALDAIVEAITEPTTESPNTQSRKMTTGQHASILPQGRKGQGEIIPTC